MLGYMELPISLGSLHSSTTLSPPAFIPAPITEKELAAALQEPIQRIQDCVNI